MQLFKLAKLASWLAMVALMFAFPLFSHAQGTATALAGKVVQVIQVGDETLVQLDTTGDGIADALLKLDHNDQVFGPQGQPLTGDQLQVGMDLTVSPATLDENGGYYEIAKDGTSANQQPALSGTVTEVSQDDSGREVYVLLDTDGDGVGDVRVKLESGDTVLGPDGQPIDLSQLTPGSVITVAAYRYDSENGVFEAESAQNDAKSSSDNAMSEEDAQGDQGSDDSQDDASGDGQDDDATDDQGDDSNSGDHGSGQDDNGDDGEDDDGEDD